MYLLYLDESGTHEASDVVVVGGLAIFERSVYWLVKAFNEVAKAHLPAGHESAPLHAHQFWRRDDQTTDEVPYREMPSVLRRRLGDAAYLALRDTQHGIYFASIVDKKFAGSVLKRDPYEVAFEDIVSRFDMLLTRMHAQGNTQRGLVIVAESQARERIEPLGHRILAEGTQWSQTKNIADVPMFSPVKHTRLLQAADLICNAVYSRFHHGYALQFDRLLPKFDQENGRMHGLSHLAFDPNSCFCPGCLTKRSIAAAVVTRRPSSGTPDSTESAPLLHVPAKTALAQGKKVYLPVTVEGNPESMPSAIQFDLDFPSEWMTFLGASLEEFGQVEKKVSASELDDRSDVVRVVVTGSNAQRIPSGAVVLLCFKCYAADSSGGESDQLRLLSVVASTPDGKRTTVRTRGGQVSCDWKRSLSGRGRYAPYAGESREDDTPF